MRSAVVNELHPDGIKDKNRFHWAGAVNPVQRGREGGRQKAEGMAQRAGGRGKRTEDGRQLSVIGV